MNVEDSIELALTEISKGIEEIIDKKRLETLVRDFYENNKNYYVKAGFDPTAPDLHLGHMVLLKKLSQLQKHGAIIQFLIGDFTATIGDPTGKNSTRKILSNEDVLENAETYKTQVFKVLDEEKTEVVFNKNWLEKMGPGELISLTSNLTVSRLLERDDFKKRFKSNVPIAVNEFIYPLLQGFDSVHLKSDMEIGGTDQKFNLLMGRQLQKIYGMKQQQTVIMMPILEGLNGGDKMSKSLNNYVGIAENPKSIFGKLLSISDDLMWNYYKLLTDKSIKEIEDIKRNVVTGEFHPKKVKEELAIEIIDTIHGEGKGFIASKEFEQIFVKKEDPTELKEFKIDNGSWICEVLVETGLEKSKSSARRMINQNAVKLNKTIITDENLKLNPGEYTLQKGKKGFVRLIVS